MNAVPFDTLKLARGLEAAGLAAPVAAGTAAALADAMGGADFATKADISAVKADIGMLESKVLGAVSALDAKFDSKFSSQEAKFDARLELLRRDITIKLGSIMFIATGVILAAMRLMPHP